MSWYEAAQFCNYLTSGDKSLGAYLFSGNNINPGDFLGIDRASAVSAHGIAYVLPTEDEWYKAAYHTGSGYSTYADGTDVAPIAGVDTNYDQDSLPYDGPWDVGTGIMEQNGTFDIMGNVMEWNETAISFYRVVRGGTYNSIDIIDLGTSYHIDHYRPYLESANMGLRVVEVVPAPGALLLCALGLSFAGLKLRRRKEL